MNPEHSFKHWQKGVVPIQSIFHLTTPKDIVRDCRPDIQQYLFRQNVARK